MLLPLFPLDLVLLPTAPLPLHIFEPRYREMIAECLEEKKVFGVLRAQGNGIAEIGCTAEILSVAKTYPDGRMDIITQGRQRFEVMQITQERSFLQGEVVYLHDQPGTSSAEERVRALQLHSEMLSLAGASPVDVKEATESLSFMLAGPLPLDLDFKQTLLGMRSEPERLQAVISFFETILPSLRRTVEIRRKAGGNGHAV